MEKLYTEAFHGGLASQLEETEIKEKYNSPQLLGQILYRPNHNNVLLEFPKFRVENVVITFF